jgi:hypothetical protein
MIAESDESVIHLARTFSDSLSRSSHTVSAARGLTACLWINMRPSARRSGALAKRSTCAYASVMYVCMCVCAHVCMCPPVNQGRRISFTHQDSGIVSADRRVGREAWVRVCLSKHS